MKRIVHLIPYHAIGGVETAAKSVPTGISGTVQFERQYLVRMPGTTSEAGEYHGPYVTTNSPRAYWHAIWRLYQSPPDLLVASLWRSALVLIVLKILRPNTKVVLFLHLAINVHIVDRIVNRIAMELSDAIWADSTVTLQKRVPSRLQVKGRVISFLLNYRVRPQLRNPEPRFIFWGRLNAQKGLKRALNVFAAIHRIRPDALLTIIGPDGGVENDLRLRITELELNKRVTLKGPMQPDDIVSEAERASFYLQTSRNEGMAISVVEAMQAGLVPVVTPVGEIARYCQDGENAVFVHEDLAARDAVSALLSDPERYKQMSRAAAERWEKKPLYRDDFLGSAKNLIVGSEYET